MAGQARRDTRGQGRSSRGDSSSVVLAAASAAESGSVIATTTTPSTPPKKSATATRATYQHLLLKGMAPDEAANLTAFLAGIPIAEVHWTLRQINQLLFLRQMNRSGHFGDSDGESSR